MLIFVCFRDYLWQNGSKLMKILEIGKQSLYLFPHLCHNFLSKLPILWKIWTQELSMTLLPKPKISMAGHKCPKCSTSSIKELVSILFLSVSAPPLYLDDTVSLLWVIINVVSCLFTIWLFTLTWWWNQTFNSIGIILQNEMLVFCQIKAHCVELFFLW